MKRKSSIHSTKHSVNLSVVLATLNEETTIGACLKSVKDIANEIVIFDEGSTDKTVEIAKSYGAKVVNYVHKTNFHETKQMAIDAAKGEWILQLDADERVSSELASEIKSVLNNRHSEFTSESRFRIKSGMTIEEKQKLFDRHEALIRKREGGLGKDTGEVVAFFIPRINYFVGKPLMHAGVYPDGVIRLIKRGKARLPAKSVHEVMKVDGEVGWLFNDLEHHESPTLHRYIERANRYTDLTAKELEKKKIAKSNWQLFNYTIVKPKLTFLKLYIRHKGYKDGIRGFLWSFFSAFHFPLAYWKYWVGEVK